MADERFYKSVWQRVREMEKTQFQYRNHKRLVPDVPILTKADLRKKPVDPALPTATSSGSTGEPVVVQKFPEQFVWMQASNIRELLWRRWDTSKNLAVVTAKIDAPRVAAWQINPYVFKNMPGKVYSHPLRGDLQQWLATVNCDYLFSYPSVIKTLDTSSLLDIKSTGEQGGTLYSCEEVGVIAIECPDNPEVYHVMENIVVEIGKDNDILVTDLAHPYLKRYRLGDRGEFASCPCGRKLQTLKKAVLGRVRNMAVAPDGSRFWPQFGTVDFPRVAPNLKQCQAVQLSSSHIVLRVVGAITPDEHEAILMVMRQRLGEGYRFELVPVEGFPAGKFEEFICNI